MFANVRRARCHNLCRRYKTDSKHYAQQPQLNAKNQESKVVEVDFAKAKHGTFFQQPPQFRNPWTSDTFATKLTQLYLPKEVFRPVTVDLTRFGDRIVSEIDALGNECENYPPTLTHFDAWGNRIDEINTCSAWKQQKAISAEEGVVAIAYENAYREYSRFYQVLKLYLYAPSSGLYSCPIAMTDGAAKCIKSLGLTQQSVYKNAFERLTTRDASQFWTSGQWMTEKGGGSDVANGTETLALHDGDDEYKLYGYKWFSSATDSDMTLTLARIVDNDGNKTAGTKGLTMFYLETRNEDTKQLNNINVVKLKNKLGTRQLPTAELLLDGTRAFKMSNEGRGVASIADMLQITRLHNSLSAVSGMRRSLAMATDYASKRKAFGNTLSRYPLHNNTLAELEIETRAAFVLIAEMARLLGADENKVGSDNDKMILRLLNPVVKLYTAKQSIAVASECLESFGGQGYIEDTGLPKLLRDAQVLSIWEGTSNVLSLDVLRVLNKSNGEALVCFNNVVNQKLRKALTTSGDLKSSAETIADGLNEMAKIIAENPRLLESGARYFAFSLARTYAAAVLIDLATKTGDQDIVVTATRWASQDLFPFLTNNRKGMFSAQYAKENRDMLYS
ncbi:Acyl-CoA dehydrogenase family member 11 [Pseudolycoriella hygida]|uniref:Acyl-CoA dehydrogenase family member 11 n=1 Tax=Pseudolycoriella hygida TaxID=35572 RepID=A0A9Q0NF64_9DIPT|nr:Acyl-CoA dehydrogenase family member 11 [Pseudolycoriella hygida]